MAFYLILLKVLCIVNVLLLRRNIEQESLALSSMARDDTPASSTAAVLLAAMRGKVGSEFET